ncbi:MAG TPA: hypothetical protein DHW64_07485 [Chitinophagaceae bacterium]|nr:hypothetical protein [Chitinophagaceae bacterium]
MKSIINKIAGSVLFLLFGCIQVHAQAKGKFNVDSLVMHRTLSMQKILSLDSVQIVEVKKLNKQLLQKMEDAGAQKTETAKRLEGINDAKEKYEKALAKILSKDQLDRYRAEETKRVKDFETKAADKKIPIKKLN